MNFLNNTFFNPSKREKLFNNWQQEKENIRVFISLGNKTWYLISRTPFLLDFLIIIFQPSNLRCMNSCCNLIEDVLC